MRFICALIGHKWITVKEVGIVARPGGMLPSLDGYMAYAPDPDGPDRACTRCRALGERP